MPRLSIFHGTSRSNRIEGWNEPVDFCRNCYPRNLQVAERRLNTGRVYIDMDVEHPDYEQDAFRCDSCERLLDQRDN